jgi:2-keto-3-deoxy-L-rhamnonate aldolase RhmA
VIAQIETERGLDRVDEVAAVDGVDVRWVGQFDLSNFLGIPGQFDDPRFDQALRRVAQVARQHDKAAGFMASDGAWIDRVRALGYTMIAVGTDQGLYGAAVRSLVARVDASNAPGDRAPSKRSG